jgi:hypothetical protein
MGSRRQNSQNDTMRRWLAAHGCAFDPPPHHSGPLPVRIRQAGAVESMIFRITPGLTGLCIWLQIATEVTRGIRIADVELELQRAPEMHFELLGPPARHEERSYTFPGGFKVERADVLNHCIPGVVYANQPWEGFLACVSMQRLPADVGHHARARLTLRDDFREVGTAELQMALDPHEHGHGRLRKSGDSARLVP